MSDLQTLIRECKANGVAVRKTNGGHYEFKAPDGEPIFGGSTPGNESESVKKIRADLKTHGYNGPNGNVKNGKRRKASQGQTKNADLAIQILGKLQLHPGEGFRPSVLAEDFGRPLKDCANALATLKRSHPEVINPERGIWMYSPDPLRSPVVTRAEGQVPVEPRKPRSWGARGKVHQWIKDHPRETLTTEHIAQAVELQTSTVRQALYSLQTEVFKEELQKPGRGLWRYAPKELDEEGRIRLRINMLHHEMEKKDYCDLPPLFRRLAVEEEERLKECLEKPKPIPPPVIPEEPAVEPVTVAVLPAARPITVVPSELPENCSTYFEAITVHPTGGIVNKDENGELWINFPIAINFPKR